MRVYVLLLTVLLLLSGSAHMFNHQDRHDECEVYEEDLGIHPNEHHLNDGHVHTHHATAAESAHYHGDILYPAGHTHELHRHDPCNQVGMNIPAYQDEGDLQALSIEDAIIGKPSTSTLNVILEGEAYKLPLLQEQRNLVVMGDNSLAAQGFPGSGTPEDPYIIEGYHIRNVMQFKDTNACIVVRNNVVYDDIIEGPIVDPDDIIDRRVLDKAFEEAIAGLEKQLSDLSEAIAQTESSLGDVPEQQTANQQKQADEQATLAILRAQVQALQQEMAELEAQQAERQQQGELAALYGQNLQARKETNGELLLDLGAMFNAFTSQFESFVEEYKAFEATYEPPSPPPNNLQQLQDDELANELGIFTDQFENHAAKAAPVAPESEANQKRFQQYQEEYEELLQRMDNYIAAIDQANQKRDDIQALIEAHTASEEERQAGDEELEADIAALKGRISDADANVAKKQSDIATLQAQLEALAIQHASLLQQLDSQMASQSLLQGNLAETSAAHAELLILLAEGIYEYAGDSYDSLGQLAQSVLDSLEDTVENELAGRMIFDWNGQCIHAYHNVVQDLRVNRNNDRRGYATGGVLEENRFFTIGQIRHYDGEFRENVVGDRAILEAFVDPDAAPVTSRAINNDGANQGYFHDNLIFGGVDLDFHGHHHGAGFFATEGHYHGSDDRIKYMYDENGQPMTFGDGHEGHGHHEGDQVPHHNHGLRWTSVKFEDNTVIDPFGRGLRYEDRNHEGDDRFANSENMRELDRPHMHRTLIELEKNTVVGHLELDIVNADGVEVWTDDYSEVERDTTTQEVVNALLHLGADIVNSHMGRNQAWVDVATNDVYVIDGAGINLHDVKEAEMAIEENRVFAIPRGFESGDAFLKFLTDADGKSADAVAQGLGETNAFVVGIQAKRVKDSNIDICENDFRGATVGVLAKNKIYEDVLIRTCSDNTWGTADPRVDVAFTQYPKEEALLTQPLRDYTEDTVVEHAADAVFDDVDDVGSLL